MRTKDLSKINIRDVDFYLEDEEAIDDTFREDRAGRKQENRASRKVDHSIERKKLKRESDDKNSYWRG